MTSGRSAVQDSGYAWAVVIILMITYTVAFIDRQVLSLLVEPVKRNLGVSDTQLSLLQGVGFIGSYLLFGLMFGRLADNGNRRNILIAAVVAWSVASVACGFAETYPMLLLGRVAVGAAEAALGPCAISLVTDYFSSARLPRALSIQYLGTYLGGGLALVFGGMVIGATPEIARALPMLAGRQPWQMAFIFIGAPGLLLVLLLLAVREPQRLQAGAIASRHFTLAEAAAHLWQERGFYASFVGAMTLIVLVLYTLPAWMPALVVRTFGTDAREVGVLYGSLSLISGCLGVLAGPAINAVVARRFPQTSVVVCIIGTAVVLASVTTLIAFAPNATAAIILACIGTLCYSIPQALASTALLSATPNRMRGLVQALYIFCVSGVGLGIGPTLVALITDHGFGSPQGVRWSLPLVCGAASAGAALLAARAVGPYRRVVGCASEPEGDPTV